jgi:hypothetical protein
LVKIWFDTEFYENGDTIELISIGAVRDDGQTFYAETINATSICWNSDWLMKNVRPHLIGGGLPRRQIAQKFFEFAGEKPEFWAYYGAYDWVVLCQLYGTMMQLPKGWPMFCRDVKQLSCDLGDPELPKQATTEHHALADALWTRQAHDYLAGWGRIVVRPHSPGGDPPQPQETTMANVYEGKPDARQSDDVNHPVSRFRPTYRALTDREKALHDEIKTKASELEALFDRVMTEAKGKSMTRGRYAALGMTALEQSVMWTVKELTS